MLASHLLAARERKERKGEDQKSLRSLRSSAASSFGCGSAALSSLAANFGFRLELIPPGPDFSKFRLGSARASRAAWGDSPQSCTFYFFHTGVALDTETVGEAPTATREGACAPREL